ncbi:17718_t:CDS:2, partial [Cetraspora pellucida]
EAEDYYSTHTSETARSTDKKDELIEALVKQVQQLSVYYVVLNDKKEKDIPEPERCCDNYQEPRREIICYGCREMGHIAREIRRLAQVRRVNYIVQDKDELYTLEKRKPQFQADEPKKRPRLQAESRWETA